MERSVLVWEQKSPFEVYWLCCLELVMVLLWTCFHMYKDRNSFWPFFFPTTIIKHIRIPNSEASFRGVREGLCSSKWTQILLVHRFEKHWGKQRKSWNHTARGMLQRPCRSGYSWRMRWRCSITTSRSKMQRSSCWLPRRGWDLSSCDLPTVLFSHPHCPLPFLCPSTSLPLLVLLLDKEISWW